MLEEESLFNIAVDELMRIFGAPYLRKTNKTRRHARGMVDGDTFMLFLGIKGRTDLPYRPANDHGWVVYGDARVKSHTGEIKKVDYILV